MSGFLKTGFLLSILLMTLSAGVRASTVPRPDPVGDSEIPIRGAPYYIEGIEIGSPVADFGSHAGFKAGTQSEGPFGAPLFISSGNLLNAIFYTTRADAAGKLDHIFLWAENPTISAVLFRPAGERRIVFSPYGWEEYASDGGIEAHAGLVTLGTDTFLLFSEFRNTSSTNLVMAPRITVQKDIGQGYESFIPLLYALSGTFTSGALVLDALGTYFNRPFEVIRAVSPGFSLDAVPVTSDTSLYSYTLQGSPITLSAGQAVTVYAVVAVTDSTVQGALNLAGAGMSMIAGDPWGAWRRTVSAWDNFFAGLPVPHTSSQDDARTYRLAASALRMNLYAPRASMPGWISVPCKVHFNGFYGWDTPFHSIGIKEWDPALAMENLTTQAAGQASDGRFLNEMDDSMGRTSLSAGRSQPPVQGWAVWAVAERARSLGTGDDVLLPWLRGMYDAGKRNIAFWFRDRDINRDGLAEYLNALESGWDDTPRLPLYSSFLSGARGLRDATNVGALDLNCWLVMYYQAMGRMAGALGLTSEQRMWKAAAESLSGLIRSRMWDDHDGAYYDLGRAPMPRVKTPVMFWPLFSGIERDPARAKSVIEGHLLNPDEFWGDPDDPATPRWPVPTVAYNDPAYNTAQDGYYWEGNIWLITNYAALQALNRYGYEKEAGILKARTLKMVASADPGGIHETFDALSGAVGWGSMPGEASAFQFGWSSAFLMEMLLDRHQSERFVMPDEETLSGYIARAERIDTEGKTFYQVDDVGGELPLSRVSSEDGRPLLRSVRLDVSVTDPYGSLMTDTIRVRFPSYPSAGVILIKRDGTTEDVTVTQEAQGISFPAVLSSVKSGVDHYEIRPLWGIPGCSCRAAADASWSLGQIVMGLLPFLCVIAVLRGFSRCRTRPS